MFNVISLSEQIKMTVSGFLSDVIALVYISVWDVWDAVWDICPLYEVGVHQYNECIIKVLRKGQLFCSNASENFLTDAFFSSLFIK